MTPKERKERRALDQRALRAMDWYAASHTPAPWKVEADWNGELAPFDMNGDSLLHGESCKALEEREANARLIAAAPDLLEACEQAEHWLSQDDRSIEPAEMLRVLRAAIAKATRS